MVHGTIIAYAFDTQAGGCLAIAADDSLSPIFYYSLHNRLSMPFVPPAQVIIQAFGAKVIEAQTAPHHLTAIADPLWAALSDYSYSETAVEQLGEFPSAPVGPLLTSTWDQLEPYNDQCPMYFGERCVVGCVATAMAQIMRYWKHPSSGTGSHCYFWDFGGETLCADFGSTTYDWANMPDSATSSSPQAIKDAVSTLCFHCGVSVDTDYGPESWGGSGAFLSDVGPALANYFGYAPARYLLREHYNLPEWYSLICSQIDAGQPVLYGAKEHAVVVDGYDALMLVHLNMGWGGKDDGWYSIGAGPQDYTEAVVDIRPNAPTISLSLTSLFNTCEHGTDAPSQTFQVWNSGIETLTYSISDDATWLSCSPTSGSSTGERDTIQVTYGTSGLPSGAYSATITVSASGAINSPSTVTVSLSVKQPTPTIAFSPAEFNNACEWGEDSPTQSFELWNSGIEALNYSISDDVQWLSCHPNSGNSTGERDTIEVVYSTSGLQAGSHTATITVSAPEAVNSPQTIPVHLTVERPYTVWYVDGSVSFSGEGTSWETAFKTIQEAIDTASDGDKVIVAEESYAENIHFHGKNIELTSTDPFDPSVVANTIINGNQAGSVVSFDGTEDETCLLSGFTIQNGSAQQGGGVRGGALANHTHATIRNNVIESNSAQWGGGLCWCDGVIENNVISQNSAGWYGGGLYDCDGAIRSNLLVGNIAQKSGGGACNCDGRIESNTITENSAEEQWGGGLFQCKGAIANCIIWENTANGGAQLHGSSAPTYSCIQDWTAGGEGNISGDPQFADSDYHLSHDSPCIDAGKNEQWMWDAADLDGKPRILPGRSTLTVDMGSHEYGSVPFEMSEVARGANGNVLLKWTSRQGKRYGIWSCLDLCDDAWIEVATIDSQGSTTSWTDTAPAERKKFYRVELK